MMLLENNLTRNIVTVASFYLQNNDFQTTLRFQYHKDNTLGQFKIEDQVRGATENSGTLDQNNARIVNPSSTYTVGQKI